MTELTDDTFDAEVLKSPLPVLVDFWAPWCGPCRAIAPAVEEISKEYASRLRVAKYNVDDHNRYAAEFGIRGIPALFIFKGGQIVERIVGAVPKATMVQKIEAAIS